MVVFLWKVPLQPWGWQQWKPEIRDADWRTLRGQRGRFPAEVPRRLVAVGDRVYVTLGIHDAPVSILDAATGEVLAECEGSEGTREIVVDNHTVFAHVRPSAADAAQRRGENVSTRLMALDATTGETRWSQDVGKINPLSLAADDGAVVFLRGADLLCYDQQDGHTALESGLPAERNRRDPQGCRADHRERWHQCLFAGRWQSPLERSRHGPRSAGDRRPGLACPGNEWHPRTAHGALADPLATGRRAVVRLRFPHRGRTPHHRRRERHVARPSSALLSQQSDRPVHHLSQTGCRVSRSGRRQPHASRLAARLMPFRRHTVQRAALHAAGPVFLLRRREDGRAGGNQQRRHNATCSILVHRSDCQKVPPTGAPVADAGGSGGLAGIPRRRQAKRFEPRRRTSRASCSKSGKSRWEANSRSRRLRRAKSSSPRWIVTRFTLCDAATGKLLWKFIAGGRVDSSPTYHAGLLLFGANDGCVYCLNAHDGALVWRFLAAPNERRIVAFGQVESPWPVHGTVLVMNSLAYVAAGRSTLIDGGAHFYALEPRTGKVVHYRHVEQPQPDLSKDIGEHFAMDGSNIDVLTTDGKHIFCMQEMFDAELNHIETEWNTRHGDRYLGDDHLMATGGMLDDTGFNRIYWSYGNRWPGFYFMLMAPKSGNLLVFDDAAHLGHEMVCRAEHPQRAVLSRDDRLPAVLRQEHHAAVPGGRSRRAGADQVVARHADGAVQVRWSHDHRIGTTISRWRWTKEPASLAARRPSGSSTFRCASKPWR